MFLIMFMYFPLTPFHLQQLKQITRDRIVELARLYAKVDWLKQHKDSLIARLNEANTLVSDLGAQDRAQKEELA